MYSNALVVVAAAAEVIGTDVVVADASVYVATGTVDGDAVVAAGVVTVWLGSVPQSVLAPVQQFNQSRAALVLALSQGWSTPR